MALLCNMSSLDDEELGKIAPAVAARVTTRIDYVRDLSMTDPNPKVTLLKRLWRSREPELVYFLNDHDSVGLLRLHLLRLVSLGRRAVVLDRNGAELSLTTTSLLIAAFRWWRARRAEQAELRRVERVIAETQARAREAIPGPRDADLSRVVFLHSDLIPFVKAGGSVAHITGVISGLEGRGSEVRMFTGARIPAVEEGGVNVTRVDLLSGRADWREALLFGDHIVRRCLEELGEWRPKAVYWRHSLGGVAGVLLARALGCPLILEFNGSEVYSVEKWSKGGAPLPDRERYLEAEMVSFEAASLIVVVSRVIEDELVERGVPREKILTNPNGVRLERFPERSAEERQAIRAELGFGEDDIVAAFIGTFGKWHGATLLASSVKAAVEREPRLRFLLIGDGAFMGEVRQVLAADGVADKVVLTGLVPQTEAPRLLAAGDFTVSPHVPNDDGSKFFGSPTKLFEYMALGKGIVASRLDQIGEVLEHDRTAWLIEPGDRDALVDGMVRLAADQALRDRLGREALAEVSRAWTWQANVDRMVEAWEQRVAG